jgi:hypothetical protein
MAIKTSNIEIQKSSSRGASNQPVARAGEHFVAAELNKRGALQSLLLARCRRLICWPVTQIKAALSRFK